jgi:hypothetical protein
VADLVDRLYKNPNAYSAAELLEASVYSQDELVRVSAASSYFDLRPEKSKLLNILVDGTHSDQDLVRDVAATSLSHVAPEHERLRSMAPTGAGAAASGSLNTAILIHGTFARSYPWWKPKGDFHQYILTQVRSDLYAAADYFGWSGGYSDNARSQGADSLADWVKQRPSVHPPDLITHSHGGSVVMLATLAGLQVGSLALLSCPVHVHKYLPDFANVKRVVSVRVHMDLVILADRGGQRFDHPNITENVLPLWFDHGATHSAEVWQKYNIRSML